MKNIKGFAHIILLVGLAIIAIGAILFLSIKKQAVVTTPPSPETIVEADLKNLKEYTNDDVGISFTYDAQVFALSEENVDGVYDIYLQYCHDKERSQKYGEGLCKTQTDIVGMSIRYYTGGNAPAGSSGENNKCLLDTLWLYASNKAVISQANFRTFIYEASESNLKACGFENKLKLGQRRYYYSSNPKALPVVIEIKNPSDEENNAYKNLISTIVFTKTKITEDKAISLVMQLPEIQDWVKATGIKPDTNALSNKGYWQIAVGQLGGNYPFFYKVSKVTGDIQER